MRVLFRACVSGVLSLLLWRKQHLVFAVSGSQPFSNCSGYRSLEVCLLQDKSAGADCKRPWLSLWWWISEPVGFLHQFENRIWFFFFFFGQNITDALCSVKETGDRQGPTQTCYVRCLRSSWTGYAKSPSFPTLDYIWKREITLWVDGVMCEPCWTEVLTPIVCPSISGFVTF